MVCSILSFTTEEIFKLVNKNNSEKSIHLKKLNIFPKTWNNIEARTKLEKNN